MLNNYHPEALATCRRRIKALRLEVESTVDKLSDVWIHLDAWARGEGDIEYIRKTAASILIHQEAPGWKGKPKPEF